MGWFDNFRRKRQAEQNEHTQPQEAPEKEEPAVSSEAASEPVSEPEEVEIPVYEAEDLEPDPPAPEPFDPETAEVPVESGLSQQVSREIKTLEEKKPVSHVIGETKVIAILNQKGGVGKSTTAVNLSAALGAKNKAVLLIDLDPQGNATSGLGIDKGQITFDTYNVLLEDTDIEQAIIPDVCEGLDLLPATINLAGAEVELVNEMARENRLKAATGSLRGKYDYIFIDCPPSLGLLTVNALVAADKLLIPIQCEFYALEGVTKLLDSMKRVKSMLNPSLDVFGVLLTMYDSRTTLSKQVADDVRAYFKAAAFETVIPRTVKISEAPSYGQPITEYDPTGKGAQAYMSLAEEVINRG